MKKFLLNHNIIGYECSLKNYINVQNCPLPVSVMNMIHKLNKIVHVHVKVFALNLFIIYTI